MRFINRTDFPTAMHWHGMRLDNRFDGVPHVTQEPVPPGESFDYRVHFRDAGHLLVSPAPSRGRAAGPRASTATCWCSSRDPGYFAPANREEVLMLDDLLVADSGPVGYGHESPTHALMGRFGNALLVNGEPRWETQRPPRRGGALLSHQRLQHARLQSVVRGRRARMKVVASDLGRYEREAWVDNVTIAPAERYVVDVRFPASGDVALVNRVRAIDHIMARFFEEKHVLGVVHVAPAAATPDYRRRALHGCATMRRSPPRSTPIASISTVPSITSSPSRCNRAICRFRCGRFSASNRSTATRSSGAGRCPRWTGS